MKFYLIPLSSIFVLIFGCTNLTIDYPIKPVPFTDVVIEDNFWTPRLQTSAEVTIPVCFQRCEKTGRIDNFAIAAGLIDGKYRGARYNDSDLYKILEGASYQLSVTPDPELKKYLDEVIATIAAAQEDDGYLSTLRTINPELDINKTQDTPQSHLEMYGKRRWTRMDHGHELYCAGHMYEAAVAHYQATGKRSFLDIAIKNADLIYSIFGSGENQIRNVPGHQEIELALVKLYRVTGNKKYLNLAKFFLDERGHYNGRTVHTLRGRDTYCQDDKPVVEQTTPHGHVVRAVYMYSAMADIAALTGDEQYIKAIDKIWDNIISKRLYLIGSMGVHGYLEGFGPDYKLPNQDAYNETCATIGNVFLNHRLFLLHKDAKYIDVLERSIYNGVLSGVSLEGDKFFYPNPLASDGKNKNHARSPWFKVACCPANIARFMPSLSGYIYAHSVDDLYINLFIAGKAEIQMQRGALKVSQTTDYPWNGKVTIEIEPDTERYFSILIRIPGWAQNNPVPSDLYRYMKKSHAEVEIFVNGQSIEVVPQKGYVRINRRWKKGDAITLDLPIPVRRVLSHEKVEDNVSRVALERGPIVYCAEWIDNGGKALDIVLGDNIDLNTEHKNETLGRITVITGTLDDGSLFTAIPYYSWAHRGQGEMNVWLNRN